MTNIPAKWICAGMLATGAAHGALLTNPGFETDALNGWITFGQGWRTGLGAGQRQRHAHIAGASLERVHMQGESVIAAFHQCRA